MKLRSAAILICILVLSFMFTNCNQQANTSAENVSTPARSNGEYESQLKWGEHLVQISGCDDCHTPKKMTAMGPASDTALYLSGHPAAMPPPDVDRKQLEAKGIAATNTETCWVGPWGISYSGNLTPDSTGLANWTEDQFITCLKQGKYKGLAGERMLLPPMPWTSYMHMTDDEIKAIFAFLKTIKHIHNIAPTAAAPVTAMH